MSANSLKSKIKLKTISPNSWYYLGDRKLSILHSRLRMKCSSLNVDLFNMRIIDCLKCQCGHDSESTLHYCFQCPLYFYHRRYDYNIGIDWFTGHKGILHSGYRGK